MRLWIWALVLAAGCPATDDSDTDDDTEATDVPVPTYDCDALPEAPTETRIVPGARGYHGLAFDSEGRLVGSDNNALIRTDSQGNSEVWVPGLGELEQMVFLPSGELVVSSAEDGALWKVSAEGGRELLVADLFSYAVVLGPDNLLYTSGWRGVARVDPTTGAVETLAGVDTTQGYEPHAIGFGLDYTRLYAGVRAYPEDGSDDDLAPIYEWSVDEEVNLSSAGNVLVSALGEGWHDTLGVDVCGNLYIADFRTTTLYRVSPEGEVTVLVEWPYPFGPNPGDSDYGHALIWGTGTDGWREDALYMAMPYNDNQVQEIVIGVPSKDWRGDVLNR